MQSHRALPMFKFLIGPVSAGCALAAGIASPASAKQACGWYAIAFCSPSQDEASTFANAGWGQVVDTSKYAGFAPGHFCAVSGPQPRESAERDRASAIQNRDSASAYIKRACADEANTGD